MQDHPSVVGYMPGWKDTDEYQAVARSIIYRIPTEELAKDLCEEAARVGVTTWAHIAVEELSEAVSAPNDTERRKELIQLAAVVVSWIECLDRNGRT